MPPPDSEFLREFLSSCVPMWIYDTATLAIVEVNPAAVASYGYSHEDFLKMTILDIRPPSDVAKVLHSALSEHPVAGQVWRHEKQNGAIIHVRITSSAIEFNGRPARVVHALPVSPDGSSQEASLEPSPRLTKR